MNKWKKEIPRFRFYAPDAIDLHLAQELDCAPDEMHRKQWAREEGLCPVEDSAVKYFIPKTAWREGRFFPVEFKKQKRNCLCYLSGHWYVCWGLDYRPVDYPQPAQKEWEALTALPIKYLSKHGLAVRSYWELELQLRRSRLEAALDRERFFKDFVEGGNNELEN